MPKISIVVLTFNSIRFIRPCYDSLFTQDYQDLEIIVVDNGSKDNSVSFIRENYPQVILIENKINLGAAKARNQGIDAARGRWILILDCDTVLNKGFFKKIVEFMRGIEESVGMIQPKILNIDKRTIYSCGIYLSKLKRFYDIGKGKTDKGQFDTSKYVFGVCAAAALYNRQMLEEIKEDTGYFDERFFFLVEDVDLAFRAQRKGWKAIFYSQAKCYHTGNSSDTSKKLRQYLCWRNRKFLLMKCQLNKFKLFLISLLYDFPRFTYLFLANYYARNENLYRDISLVMAEARALKR